MSIENTDLFVLQTDEGELFKTTFEHLKNSIGNSQNARRITRTAVAGQTVFDVDPAVIASGSELVYLNGTLLVAATDYDVTNTSEVTLATAAKLGDIFEIFCDNTVTGERQDQNLGYRESATEGEVTITDGSNAIIPAADDTTAGLLTAANWTKLEGIAAGAQSNVKSNWNATSGDAEILNKPAIPTATSDLTNDSGFITADDVPEAPEGGIPEAPDNGNQYARQNRGWEIVDVPTATSDLTNDSGFITSADIPSSVVPGDGKLTINYSDGSEAGIFTANQSTGDDIVIDLPKGFSGDYNDLINKPTQLRESILAAANQTVFNLTQVTVVSGTEFVYLNGTLLSSSSDYTTTSNTITLLTAAKENDILEVISGGEITGERQYQNLGYNSSPTQGVVTITDGTSAAILPATGSRAGLLRATDYTKLSSISEGAEVNVQSDWKALPNSDAYIIDKPDTVVERITAGAGVSITPNDGTGQVTISSTVDQLEFGGSIDVTKDDVPTTTFNAVPLAIADFYVNVGSGKFNTAWANATEVVTEDTDANPGDYLVYNGSTFEHIPSGTPPGSDGLWVRNSGKLEPADKSNQVDIGNSPTDVSLNVVGKVESTATEDTNSSSTLTTKGYVDNLIPVVNNGKISFKDSDDEEVGYFEANDSRTDAQITIPSKTSSLTDDSGFKQGLDDVLDQGNIGYKELTIKENNSADAGPGTQIYHNGIISDAYILREVGSNNSGMYSGGDGVLELKTDNTNGIVVTNSSVSSERDFYLNTHKNYPYLSTDQNGKIVSKDIEGRKTYNAIDWGCDPNGVNDCSDAIKNILNDITTRFTDTVDNLVPDNLSVINFPPGNYVLKKPVVHTFGFRNNDGSIVNKVAKTHIISIQGAGQDLTHFICDQPHTDGTLSERGGFKFITLNGGDSITMENLGVVTERLKDTRARNPGISIDEPVDLDFGIYLRCDDVGTDPSSKNFGQYTGTTPDPKITLNHIYIGWDQQRGGEQRIGKVYSGGDGIRNDTVQGFIRQGITAIGFYLPIIGYVNFCSRVRTYEGNPGFSGDDGITRDDTNDGQSGNCPPSVYDATYAREDAWGLCTDNCYGGEYNHINLNLIHHYIGIKDTWYEGPVPGHPGLKVAREPKGEGGHLSHTAVISRIGMIKWRWEREPGFSMYSNHFNTQIVSCDFANMSSFFIHDNFLLNSFFGGKNIGIRLRNCQRVQIDKIAFTYENDIDYREGRAYLIDGDNPMIIMDESYDNNQQLKDDYTAGGRNKSKRETMQVYITGNHVFTNIPTGGWSYPLSEIYGEIGSGCVSESIEVHETRDFARWLPRNMLYRFLPSDPIYDPDNFVPGREDNPTIANTPIPFPDHWLIADGVQGDPAAFIYRP